MWVINIILPFFCCFFTRRPSNSRWWDELYTISSKLPRVLNVFYMYIILRVYISVYISNNYVYNMIFCRSNPIGSSSLCCCTVALHGSYNYIVGRRNLNVTLSIRYYTYIHLFILLLYGGQYGDYDFAFFLAYWTYYSAYNSDNDPETYFKTYDCGM